MSEERKRFPFSRFAACYHQPNWFVPINKVLVGLTPEQANWKESSMNSIS